MSEIVELCPAFIWTCPQCELDHFARAIVVENPELIEELRGEAGMEKWDEGDWLYAPEQVFCPCCEVFYGTKDMREREDGEEI